MRFLLSLILFLHLASLFSQTPSYYHYTTADGLASSTVYSIIQDREGYIWFATINGMSRFDGKKFTTFRTNQGLNSNSIISLAEGINGELYIGNYEKGVNVLKNGRIENYCDKIGGKSFATSYLLLDPTEKDEQKIFAYRAHGFINSISNRNTRLITHSINTYPIQINKLTSLNSNEIIALSATGLYSFKKTRLTKIPIDGLPDTDVFCLAESNDGSYVIGTRGMIYQINKDHVIKQYSINIAGNNDVCAILIDNQNNIWFSIMNKGFYYIQHGSDSIINIGIKTGLQNTLINNYLEDNEGNIWVSTYGKGVLCLNNLYLTSYNENDGMSSNSVYSIMMERSGKLFIGTFNGLNVLEKGRFDIIDGISKKATTEIINSITKDENELYIGGTFGLNDVTKKTYKGIKLNLFDWPTFCKTSGGLYLSGGTGNLILVQRSLKYRLPTSSRFHIFGDSTMINRIHTIFEDNIKNVWIGTSLGICRITLKTDAPKSWDKKFFPTDPVLNSRINSIIQDDKNNVWFAGEKGIASYSLDESKVKSFTTINGYDLSSSTSMVMDNNNRIWIGNMKGLFMLDGSVSKYLNKQTGLPSDEVLSLYYDNVKNYIYVGTSNGISILDVSLFDNHHPSLPKVKFISLKAGDSVYTNLEDLVFNPDQHDIYIDLKALNFSSPGTVRYECKLNEEWIKMDNDFLNFISLKPGTYKLQVRAQAQNTGWGDTSYLTFRILPKFVETIWFDLLMISVIAMISTIMVFWRLQINNRKVKKELELAERVNELKHQALSAMMNPHFISNSLNSVQYLVNSRRYEEANDYIAMIAKLMRKNLDTAGSGFILLSEEISRLTLYLDLEKLRFQENFSYEINVGADISTNSILIPNMIIQPFVENSLWHGIVQSGKKGLLTVSFTFEDVDVDSHTGKSLIIKITDNGIGIKEARKSKKGDHNSKGIAIIEERLRLLSDKLHLPRPIMFEDLGSQENDSHGTEVIISLPPPLYRFSVPG